MILSSLSQGFGVSLGLIVAIGAQNAFVLRQGLRREYIFSVILFCSVIDALLIAIGVLGMAKILGENPLLTRAMALVGAGFLFAYGAQALFRAIRGESLDAAASQLVSSSLKRVLAQAAAFTLLNPHVYLDTVLLLGSIGAQHTFNDQLVFIAGASCASLLWFASLGLGARRLAPIFNTAQAWRILDILVAMLMWVIAATLITNMMR